MNKFIITTTNNLEGCPVKEYLDAISTNIVLGTNAFSDFAASFTDFFGGTSGTYQNKLSLIYSTAKRALIEKAKILGANAILGFTVDFDEISGKGKGMLMISATGTACIIADNLPQSSIGLYDKFIDKDTLHTEIQKYELIKRIKERAILFNKDREFLLEYPTSKLLDVLLDLYDSKANNDIRYKYSIQHNDDFNLILESDRKFIEKYVQLFPREYIIDKVYSLCNDNKVYVYLIKNAFLFDAKHIYRLKDLNTIIELLDTDKLSYSKEDIPLMQLVCNRFEQLPDNRKMVEKKGMFGKSKSVYVCPNGHEYDTSLEYCPKCGMNGQGLTNEQVNLINKFKEKIDVLSELFKIDSISST